MRLLSVTFPISVGLFSAMLPSPVFFFLSFSFPGGFLCFLLQKKYLGSDGAGVCFSWLGRSLYFW